MIGEGTRKFDLYDFFSVFLPGATLIIGLVPFLPYDSNIFSFGTVAAGIVLGFVFGRALHAIGLLFETSTHRSEPILSIGSYDIHDFAVTTGHREQFINELQNPTQVPDGVVKEFYDCATEAYPETKLPTDWENIDNENNKEIETLYTLVRSRIHMDARGRSRTFQAILDFQRTMVFTSLVLFFIYVIYVLILVVDPEPVVGYQLYISSLDIVWWLILTFSIIFHISIYLIFERIRSSYRRYFIEYVMADFINITYQTNITDDIKDK
jgi:hypothetical protein